MYNRFHGNASSTRDDGKWQRVPHVGLGSVLREERDGWHLEIAHRTIGTVIRRDQYSVMIRRDMPAYEEYLRGFSTKAAALAAARRRIDLLKNLPVRVFHRAHRPPRP